jgi:hypothetical protein
VEQAAQFPGQHEGKVGRYEGYGETVSAGDAEANDMEFGTANLLGCDPSNCRQGCTCIVADTRFEYFA